MSRKELTVEQMAADFMVKTLGMHGLAIERELVILLKEQDKKTRHACAESILSCNEDVSGECIWKNEAHNAVMNCRGGVE